MAPNRKAKSENSTRKSRSKKRRATHRQPRWPWLLAGAALIAAIAVPIVLEAVRTASLPGERFPSQGNRHVAVGTEVPSYNSNPPTSGPHASTIAAWGVYDPEDPVPHDQELIHNMEDGGVVLWYRPAEDPEATLERIVALEQIAQGYRHIAIVPRPDMPTDFALTAWQRLQRYDSIDEESMRAFLEAYEGIDHHGP